MKKAIGVFLRILAIISGIVVLGTVAYKGGYWGIFYLKQNFAVGFIGVVFLAARLIRLLIPRSN